MAQILLIEDEALLAKSLSRFLTRKGHEAVSANSAEEGLELMESMQMDVILLDLQLPGMSGLDAIGKIRERDPEMVIIITTAFGTMATAVEAMRSGASDFLRKPLDMEEASLSVDRALANARIRRTVSYYQEKEAGRTEEDPIIDKSPRMKNVTSILNRISEMRLPNPSDYPPVLILGETGAGKDLIARTIHFKSALSDQPFIEINCTTLPKGLEEAELFGYEKGAFTGAVTSKRGLLETAGGGTVFLNEIGDLTSDAQIKLLQVIEKKSVRKIGGLRDLPLDVRIIAATNRDLKDTREFREDLFFRLNNLTIDTPPLRDRRGDLLELSKIFLKRFGIKYGVTKTLTEEAENSLLNYHWPGNVRELRQLIERVTFLSTNEKVTSTDLNLPLSTSMEFSKTFDGELRVSLPQTGVNIENIERAVILEALRQNGGNVSESARALSLGREALRYRIKRHQISDAEVNLSL